jgi:hypothetical protein
MGRTHKPRRLEDKKWRELSLGAARTRFDISAYFLGPSFLGRHLLLKWKLRNVNIPPGLTQDFSQKVFLSQATPLVTFRCSAQRKTALASSDGETYILRPIDTNSGSA